MTAGERTADEPREVTTNHGRIKCVGCDQWVYTKRDCSGGPAFFPHECPVCRTPVATSLRGS